MNLKRFNISSIFRYKSFYCLIAVAVIVAVAVITGSLTVGNSVRGSLVKRVEERLGKTETIIFSPYSYLDAAIVGLLHATTVRGVLISNGFISVSGKLIPVTVWGVDDLQIEKGQTKINRALYDEIKGKTDNNLSLQNIVLRFSAAGMIPLGSLFVTDTYTAGMRLELSSVISAELGGNLNLKNEQTTPFNVFVNREELADVLEVPAKINAILVDQIITKDEFAAAWNYKYSGLHVDTTRYYRLVHLSPSYTITSDRIFIQDKVVKTLFPSNRTYSYLSNTICNNNTGIPYSFITAVDYYDEQLLSPDEIILSDYAAKRLNVSLNDTVSVSYFVSKQLKTLVEDSVSLRVSKIVPIKNLQSDKILVAEFPGLSNVECCTDWNSDLPINMNLITDKDEAYWKEYRNTPKAIVPYFTLASRWANAFGSATALQISDINRLDDLTFEMFDIRLIYPREAGITAANSGVDFSSLFLSLGFFIIISAAMLMLVPLSEMLFYRRDEISLLKAIGFSRKRILQLLWRESIPVVLAAAIVGVAVGLLYTYLVLFLLGNVWKGATHTDGFSIYPNLMTIGIGMFVGIIISVTLLYVCIVRALKIKTKSKIVVPLQLKKSSKSLFNTSKLLWASLSYSWKQALLSFITLALGVFIIFLVGLNRRSFADSSQIRTATGGFSLWCETAVPVYHNIETEEGRAKLGLKNLPVVETDNASSLLPIISLLKYTADDASCLNLNKVVAPNVLGIDMTEIFNSDFKITKTIFNTLDSLSAIYAKPLPLCYKNTASATSVYPALVDETVLTWSLGKKLGDTLIYMGENGEPISIVLAGTIQNSIFQGYILIDKSLFSKIWSEISGSEIMLIKVQDTAIEDTKMLITQALHNYGVYVSTTAERLKMFYSVTDTYLTIFLTLGGMGLLLGIFSFIIVVRKNLVSKLNEISLYRALGFDEKREVKLLYRENVVVPLSAIIVGTLCALPGVSMGFGNVSTGTWIMVGIFLAGLVLCVVKFVKIMVKKFVGRLKL